MRLARSMIDFPSDDIIVCLPCRHSDFVIIPDVDHPENGKLPVCRTGPGASEFFAFWTANPPTPRLCAHPQGAEGYGRAAWFTNLQHRDHETQGRPADFQQYGRQSRPRGREEGLRGPGFHL